MIIDLVDKLLDRLIQLMQYRRKIRKTMFQDYIAPVYESFEELHQGYLESFERYRVLIKTSPELLQTSSALLDDINRENLFTAHERAKLLQLAKVAGEDEVGAFIKAIRSYLVDVRVLNPLSQEKEPDLIRTQMWRNSLVTELEHIIDGDWLWVFDPSCARPPMTPAEIEEGLKRRASELGIDEADPGKSQKLRADFALRALDGIVYEMQQAYSEVTESYLNIKKARSI